MDFKPTLDLEQEYKKYKNVLKNAKQGQVVTRFAPEPSGYLHLGHVKASLITYHYAKMYGGKMLLRFDDTNPSKEKQEFVDSIQEDLKKLGIEWEKITYTSDNFDYFEKHAFRLIEQGLAYCDNTPVEQMREERTAGIASKCRDFSVEENLRLFKGMKNAVNPEVLADKKKAEQKKAEQQKKNAGKEGANKGGKAAKPVKQEDLTDYSQYCLRAKISMDNKNKCMRDPVLYRCNFIPHHRTGTKYKIYPTYDFACPLIDALEGVTHAMRSKEYTDRVDQYNWVIKKCEVRKVDIFEFSRLNFVNVTLSKRKLTWFVDTNRVDGWDDPRMPTVRGILRRGLRVESLTQFMLEQGPSKKDNLMEWDKIWAQNKKLIDPFCPRYTCIKKDKICKLTIANGPENLVYSTAPINPIKEAAPALKALRPVVRSKNVYLDFDDVQNIKEGEKITLMKWGNVLVKSKKQVGDAFELVADFLPEDKDFSKKVQKISWLAADADLVSVNLIELDHLITVDKVDEEVDFATIVNDNTKFVTQCYSEPLLRQLKVDDCLQFERRGYYKVDKVTLTKDGDKKLDLLFTPDGKQTAMTKNLTQKVDQKKFIQGQQGENKAQKKQDLKNKGKTDKKEKAGKPQAQQTTLHTIFGNFRGNAILIAAAIANQPLATECIQWSELKSKDNVSKNPAGQVPYLQTKEGFLYQTGACLKYVALRSKKIQLYGATDFEKAEIDQWIDFANTDLMGSLRPILIHIWKWKEISDKDLAAAFEAATRFLSFLDQSIENKQFFVGKQISIADILLYCFLVYIFRCSFTKELREKYANLTKWFENIGKNAQVAKFYKSFSAPAQQW